MSKSEFKRLAVQRGSHTPRMLATVKEEGDMNEFEKWAESAGYSLMDKREVGTGFDLYPTTKTQGALEGWNAAYRLGQERMRERCAKECDAMAANARPSCERNYTDGDAWVEAAANAIRALPVEE